METTSKSVRNIDIKGMNGNDCVQKVSGALKAVSGVQVHSVRVGSAKIEADQAGCDEACKAITAAGFEPSASAAGPARHAANAEANSSPVRPTPRTMPNGGPNPVHSAGQLTQDATPVSTPRVQPTVKPATTDM